MKQIQTSLAGLNNLKAQSTGFQDGLSTSSYESEDLCFTSLTFWKVTKEGLKSIRESNKQYVGLLLFTDTGGYDQKDG